MTTCELLRAIRNDLSMKLTIVRLGHHGPISKQSEGHFRFLCPNCGELRATVNPRNNLAHCICCGQNFNNIDLMMIQGHEMFFEHLIDGSLGIQSSSWTDLVRNYDRLFGHVVGPLETITQRALQAGRCWHLGKSNCATAFH